MTLKDPDSRCWCPGLDAEFAVMADGVLADELLALMDAVDDSLPVLRRPFRTTPLWFGKEETPSESSELT